VICWGGRSWEKTKSTAIYEREKQPDSGEVKEINKEWGCSQYNKENAFRMVKINVHYLQEGVVRAPWKLQNTRQGLCRGGGIRPLTLFPTRNERMESTTAGVA